VTRYNALVRQQEQTYCEKVAVRMDFCRRLAMLQMLANNGFWVVLYLTVLLVAIIKIYKFNKMIEIDKNFKQYSENGQLLQEGHLRNVWDYSFFPGLSKIWLQSEWQNLVAMVSVFTILILYLVTKDQLFRDLLSVNFGVVIGMLLEGKKK